jgi:DNA-binding NtrC family response regulator
MPAVEAAAFRADLYYRLSVFTIALPPLRERREDILPLAAHLLAKHCPADREPPELSSDAQAALLSFSWPGNVRELENAMIRAVRLSDDGAVEVRHLQLPSRAPDARQARLPESLGKLGMLKQEMIRDFEQQYLSRVMHEAGGNVTRAAQIAGKDRRDLGKLLKKDGIGGACAPRSW